jgi:hypothetical protein
VAKNDYKDSDIINCLSNYRLEAKTARQSRMDQNALNFDAYHLRQDWSKKLAGQSREFLPKVSNAVEQNANIVQQGLVDLGDWFSVDSQEGIDPDTLKVKPDTVYRILQRQLEKDGFVKKVGDAMKLGMLGGLIIAKVGGKLVNKPKFVVEKKVKGGKYYNQLVKKEDKTWQLSIDLIRHEDYYPDPTGRGLYEMQDIWMDLHAVKALSEGDDAIYDKKVVDQLSGSFDSAGADQDWKKSRETGQNIAGGGFRRQVKVTEIWGTLLDSGGNVAHENCVCTIANDRFVIQQPTQNPNWHQESPYVVAPLISVPHAVWSKAIMDSASSLNLAANEIFNLSLDSGILSVHGVKQIRKNWLEDPSQVANGIPQGATLAVNDSCPPGMKVLESVFTGGQPTEAMNMMGLVNQEGAAAMFTNEVRSGGADLKNTRATAIVENSNALNNMFTGMVKNLEGDDRSGFITPLLSKAWKVVAQNMNDLDSKEMKALLTAPLADKLLAMGKEEIFADTVQSCQFKAYGISAVMNKMKEFTKLSAMLQTIFSNPMLTEEFMKKYSISKLLTEIMRSLDIKTFKIEVDEAEGGDLTAPTPPEAPVEKTAEPGADLNSQTAQIGAALNQGDQNLMASSQPSSPQSLT